MKNKLLQFLLKANWVFWLVLGLCFSSRAQTTNISGVVNSYYSVIETVPAKACVRLSSVTGLSQGNKIMLVQMKGASINTSSSTSSTFGDTTSLNNAGNYEVNYICYINGDSAFLVYNLLNSYTVSNGKVQLVKFAQYQNANVTDTVKAGTWNNTSGTGAVIAISVIGKLTLNAPISADSSGFRGGTYIQTGNFCLNSYSNYAYNGATTPTQLGAYKGECIADVPAAQSGGRGAPANGGGGGNNHNNSGGGGANLTAGGLGGGNSSNTSTGCYAIYRGGGGKALSSWSGTRIFSGGGGGAGHNNGGFSITGGGHGAGIIFIHADTIVGNGYKISASGGKGGNSLSDGAGGGGGGGTVIMDANTYTGSLIVQANGGNGGNSDDGGNLNKCFGGGGGGSGGVIYFTGATPAITIYDTAGTAGVETGRHDPSCSTPQPAFDGTDGPIINNYSYRIGNVFAGYCGLVLPAKLVSFKVTLKEKKAQLSWRMLNPELVREFVVERLAANQQWEIVSTIAAVDTQENYVAVDNAPFKGDNFYRLRIIEKNNTVSYSATRHIFIGGIKEVFSLYPNPATDKITVQGNFTGMATLSLHDISGKLILKKRITSASTTIKLPSVPKGVYLVRVNESTQKLIIR